MSQRTVNGTVRVLLKRSVSVFVPSKGGKCALDVWDGNEMKRLRISREVAEALIATGVPYGD